MTARNELQSFEEEFIKRIRENDAWKKLSASSELPWIEKLIEQYADKWDWTELSQNRAITWTAEMIDKFQARIDWNELTESITACRFHDSRPTDWDIIKKFESKWDWKTISRNANRITPVVIEQFIHKWDWRELIDNSDIKWDYKLFEQYKPYISISDFNNFSESCLWSKLVSVEERIITGKILAES